MKAFLSFFLLQKVSIYITTMFEQAKVNFLHYQQVSILVKTLKNDLLEYENISKYKNHSFAFSNMALK